MQALESDLSSRDEKFLNPLKNVEKFKWMTVAAASVGKLQNLIRGLVKYELNSKLNSSVEVRAIMKIVLAVFLVCIVLAVYFCFVLFLIELPTKLFMLLQTKKMVSLTNCA